MANILVVGRATIDLNPLEINKPLNEVDTFKKYVGGSACNTAIGLKRQGINTSVMTNVSDDQFGTYVRDYLINEKIDVDHIYQISGYNTGLTFTEIKSPTESSILMYRNGAADLQFDVCDINDEDIYNYDGVIISGTALATAKSRTAVLKIMNICIERKIKLIFDIDYRPYSWENYETIDVYYSILASNANIIVGSLEEFKLMNTTTSGKSDDEIAEYFLSKNAEHVVIKNGSKGSKYYAHDVQYQVNIFPVKLLKSFGGGDAYMSSFIAGLIKEQPINEILLKSTAHAAMLVSSHSCSDALATESEIEMFIKQSGVELNEVVERLL